MTSPRSARQLWRFNCLATVVALLVGAQLGCARKPRPPAVPEGALARVGQTVITSADVEREIARMPASVRAQYQAPDRRQALLETLIRDELLVQEARSRAHDQDPEYQRRARQQLVNLMIERAAEGRSKPEDIPATEAESYYRQHRDQFVRPASPQVSQVVLADRKQAELVLKAARGLRADDADGFAALVTRHSIDAASRARGGDLGPVERTGVSHPPAVLAAAFALQAPGQVSELIQSEQGFHILRLRQRPSVDAPPFAEVEGEVRRRMVQDWRANLVDGILARSQASFPVERLGKPGGQPTLAEASAGKGGR